MIILAIIGWILYTLSAPFLVWTLWVLLVLNEFFKGIGLLMELITNLNGTKQHTEGS